MWTSDAMTNSVCGAGQQDGCGGGDGAAGGHSRHSSLCGQPVREPGYQTATHGVCSSGTSKCHLQSFIVRCHYSDGWLCPAEVYPADENGTCKVVCHYGRWNGGEGGRWGVGGGCSVTIFVLHLKTTPTATVSVSVSVCTDQRCDGCHG